MHVGNTYALYIETAVLALAAVAHLVRASSYGRLKGHGFDSRSGHMLGLQVRSPIRSTYKRQLVDVSLPLSFPPSLSLTLKINKHGLE